MNIRRAFKKDLKEIAVVETRVYAAVATETKNPNLTKSRREAEAGWKSRDLTWTRVMVEDGQIIGVIHLENDPTLAGAKKVSALYFRPEYRDGKKAAMLLDSYKSKFTLVALTKGQVNWWLEQGFERAGSMPGREDNVVKVLRKP